VRWAADFAAQWVASYPRTTATPSPAGLFAHMVRWWKDDLSGRGYERGCPVMATAADLAGTDSAVNEQLRPALDGWARAVVDQLGRMGLTGDRSHALATLMISTLEGAIMWARVHRDVGALDTVVTELSPLLDAQLGPPDRRG
jgi:hypothetical protein